MRKLRIFEHISLDGVIDQDSDFAYGAWTAPYRTPAGLQMLTEAYGAPFDLVLGRRTYDTWSGFWPKAPSSPMGDNLNKATKYVATHRPESLAWGPVQDLGTDLIAGVRDLKATAGADLILCGSSTLTSTLLQHDLVDEVALITYPVLLGAGKRFFAEGTPGRELIFAGSRTTSTGVLINTYRYVGALPRVRP